MATISRCFTPVLGKRIRVTILNDDGTVPSAGTADSALVTDGFVEVALSSEIESGDEIIQKNANGILCVNERQADAFKRFTVDITLCGVNPFLLTMISGCEVYFDSAGAVVGFKQPEGTITSKFALELWTGLSGDKIASGYMLLPYVNGGALDSIKINGKDTIDFAIKGAYTKGGNAWGTGPYEVLDGAGTNEVQTVTVSGTPTGGTFTLAFDGQISSAIQYNATLAQFQTALDGLLGVGNGLAAGGPFPGSPVTVTFRNQLGSADMPLMTVANNSLTGGTSPNAAVAQTTPGVPGAADVLPLALDPFDHLLCLVSEVAVPAADCSPIAIPALA
jgi:hypothetical protein